MVETVYPLPSCPVSAVLLADSHNRPVEPVLEALRRRPPDLILHAGDFVYASPPASPGRLKMRESREALSLLQSCAGIAPTFVSLGNHEWMLNEQDLALIADTGVTVLDNRFVSLSIRGSSLCIGGLSSAHLTAYQTWRQRQPLSFLYPEPVREVWSGDPEPELSWLETFEQQSGYKILLCHHPEYVPRFLSCRSVDLILSGHAHGGQWRFYSPFDRRWHGVYAPGQGLFPKRTEGIHGNHIISRGLSNNTLIPRLWNPTELVFISSLH